MIRIALTLVVLLVSCTSLNATATFDSGPSTQALVKEPVNDTRRLEEMRRNLDLLEKERQKLLAELEKNSGNEGKSQPIRVELFHKVNAIMDAHEEIKRLKE